MGNRDRLARLLRTKLRSAGRGFEEARRAYESGKTTARADLPTDEEGRARIVCRRYAERRAVELDGVYPACYEAGHPDCEGCVEDVREGTVETF
ncbi:MAG: hypothetical protein ABEI11_01770 [Haloarculaceae archaeon]